MYIKFLNNNKENVFEGGLLGLFVIDLLFNLVGINYFYMYDEFYNIYFNVIFLMEGYSIYSNDFDGNLRNDIKNKLIKDNVYIVKINFK